MLGFVKKMFFAGLTILSSFISVNSLSCISMNNQGCKTDHKLLMSRTNETRHTEWHKTCKCECKFGANVCNNKQRKCRCECI